MSTKQYLIDSINADTTKLSNLKLQDYEKKATEKYVPDKEVEAGVINSTYDKAKANAQATNDKAVKDTNIEYEEAYQRNAVQKLINEKQIAEKNANLGLTDSGLNRTQQTAAQLSYANQKGKIDIVRQSALDNLANNLNSALTEIETNRSIDIFNSEQKWKDIASSEAKNNYNNDVTAINDRITSAYGEYGKIAEAEIDANTKKYQAMVDAAAVENNKSSSLIKKNIISRGYTGTLESNGIRWARFTDDNGNDKVKYVDSNTGDTVIMDWGQNPYTLDNNLAEFNDSETALAAKHFGVYSHGYQPKGLCVFKNGKPVYYDFKSSESYYVEALGRNQNVFKTEDDTEWIWNDAGNKYVRWNYDRKTGKVKLPDWVY